MGIFGGVRKMFDGKPGSPVEDWLRQQGIMAAQGAAPVQGGFHTVPNMPTNPASLGRPLGARPAYVAPPPSEPSALLPDYMGGIRNALADNAMIPAQPGARPGAVPVPVAGSMHGDGPDFAGHYAMHGRDAHGLMGRKKRSTGQKILGFIGDFATNYMASQGDQGAILALRNKAARREARQQQEADFQGHDRIVRLLMARGMSAEDAELAALDPKSIGTELNTRFRTREASQGETIYTPGIGNQPASTYTAPLIVENGPQRVRLDANTGTSQVVFEGKTPAEWAAQEAGLAVGSPEYLRFMRDFHLDGQGPTAVDMNAARLGQSDINNLRSVGASIGNNIRSTGTSAANNIRSTGVSRENNIRTTGTSRANAGLRADVTRGSAGYQGRGGRGARAAVARGPNGETITWNGRAWVDAQGRPVS